MLVFVLGSCVVNAQTSGGTKNVHELLSKMENLLASPNDESTFTNDSIIEEINSIKLEVASFIGQDFPEKELLADKMDELDLLKASIVGNEEEGSTARTGTWRYGDILYYGIGADNAAGESSFTGHTAVLAVNPSYVVEASKTSNNGAKVHYWNVKNLWKGASGIKQYYVHEYGDDSARATDKQRNAAVAFGVKQKDKPYAIRTPLWDDDSWYCSKLTYRQWYEAGIDLIPPIPGAGVLTFVLPLDIRMSAATSLTKDWGTTLPEPY